MATSKQVLGLSWRRDIFYIKNPQRMAQMPIIFSGANRLVAIFSGWK